MTDKNNKEAMARETLLFFGVQGSQAEPSAFLFFFSRSEDWVCWLCCEIFHISNGCKDDNGSHLKTARMVDRVSRVTHQF